MTFAHSPSVHTQMLQKLRRHEVSEEKNSRIGLPITKGKREGPRGDLRCTASDTDNWLAKRTESLREREGQKRPWSTARELSANAVSSSQKLALSMHGGYIHN